MGNGSNRKRLTIPSFPAFFRTKWNVVWIKIGLLGQFDSRIPDFRFRLNRLQGNSMESLAGKLLIAIPELHDANFFQSVVLLFQHDDEGASGVILNRPANVTIAEVWDEVAREPSDCPDFVHIGGPVEGPLIALHTSLALAETPVVAGLYLSMGREKLNQLVNQSDQPFKIYSGYSGWGPGQLESEIEQGGWLTLPASANEVFDSQEGLWKQVCSQVGNDILKPHFGKFMSTDPTLN